MHYYSFDNRYWIAARKDYLVPVYALSDIFRATFIALARRKLPGIAFPASIWKTRWVVYCKPCYHAADKTLTYLARYIHQTAIVNSRILTTEQGKVTFRYKDSRECRWKTMTLEASEFIRRFLQHVLPRGFHKVRYYGFLSPRNRRLREQVQWELTKNTETTAGEPSTTNGNSSTASDQSLFRCPLCHEGYLIQTDHDASPQMEGSAMTFICMNPYEPLFRSAASETIGFLLSYSCAQTTYSTLASQSNATIHTMIRIQYDPIVSNIFDLFLDFVGNFPHSIFQTNTCDD